MPSKWPKLIKNTLSEPLQPPSTPINKPTWPVKQSIPKFTRLTTLIRTSWSQRRRQTSCLISKTSILRWHLQTRHLSGLTMSKSSSKSQIKLILTSLVSKSVSVISPLSSTWLRWSRQWHRMQLNVKLTDKSVVWLKSLNTVRQKTCISPCQALRMLLSASARTYLISSTSIT